MNDFFTFFFESVIMEWFNDLVFSTSIAHSILLLALTITVGILLNGIKIGKVSLGIAWILFVGIFFSHFGLRLDRHVADFVKEFGLILFVYSIGLQVGPGFFASFRQGGVKLNLLSLSLVVLGCVTTYLVSVVSHTPLATMTGVLSGAVTNTPSLGAAQQTFLEMTGTPNDSIAMGYAVAYPVGVVGIILVIVLLRAIFRISADKEDALVASTQQNTSAERLNVKVTNRGIEEHKISDIKKLIDRTFVISRILRTDGTIEPADEASLIHDGDILRIVTTPENEQTLVAFFGEQVHIDSAIWETPVAHLVSKRVVVTKSELNGRRIGDLSIRASYGVNITRVTRAGVDLVATFDLRIQMGDRLTVVGREADVDKVAAMLGNSLKRLDVPNLLPIFLGIVLGVLLGSLPIMLPGMPQPVRLGLAGGPLIVAILIGRYGPAYKLVTYTTTSANLMLREVGISLFLAAVGLSAGETFVHTIVDGGYMWILYGAIITIVPALIVGIVARIWFKIDFFTIMGLLSGSTSNATSLAYAGTLGNNNRASVAYATVYPLTMFLRILAAQVMILIAI